jgi:osmotically-inducible protein OsmY
MAQKDIPAPSPLNSADAYRQLRDILRAQPWIECDLISVEMQGSRAILRGCVYSPAERVQVYVAARKLAGVTEVDNRVTLIKEQRTQTPGSTSTP